MFNRLLLIFIVFFSFTTSAEQIPDDLKQWQDWVAYQQEHKNCPLINGQAGNSKNNYLCAWPSQLRLEIDSAGIKFSQQWLVIEESKIPLPGEQNFWPQSVIINQTNVPVLEQTNRPYVLLSKGQHNITGRINWNTQPDSLLIPPQVALVELIIDGAKQAHVERRQDRIWIGREKNQQVEEQEFLKVWVNRLIADDHPMEMTIAVKLDVGGASREINLTQFDLNKIQLKSINSNLNARIDNQGTLTVQVKPGSHQLYLVFKIHDFPSEISLVESGEHWPQQEIWAYKNNERLRSTQIEQVAPIDANQGFVSGWSQFPHYVLSRGESFNIKQRNRGLSHNSDSLSLDREMWLSFDSQTYYFFDSIGGSKSKDWRVNTLPEYRLTQLSNHGQERLITYDDSNRTGAEIRTPQINIEASGEVAVNNMKHASGWDIEFASSNVKVNIPPGRKLIAISGADSSYGDWVSQWSLMDLFFILITLALVFKLFGLVPSIFALLTLLLSYHEFNMPMFLWFNFTVALSLAKTINRPNLNKILNVYKWISTGLLLLALLPFLAEQIRFTLYPQLELNQSVAYQQSSGRMSDSFLEKEPETAFQSESISSLAEKAPKVVAAGSRLKRSILQSNYEQGAIIQAGKGRPDWHWQSASYGWNGPVKGDETVRLVVLPEYAVKIFRVLMIIFSVLWLLSMLNKDGGISKRLLAIIAPNAGTKSTAALLAICLLLPLTSEVKANDIPNADLLKELQNRLYPIPECVPDCVSVAKANLSLSAQDLTLTLDFHSGAKVAGMIPSSEDWRIESLTINDKPLDHLWKNNAGSWVNLEQGLSQLVIKATLKNKSNITMQFGEQPKEFVSKLSGWEISGVNDNRLVSNSIQLTRAAQASVSSKFGRDKNVAVDISAQEQSIEDLLFVTRRLNFATQWTMDTYATRQAPLQGTITADVPLLDFEKPLEMTDYVKDNHMKVVIPNNSQSVHWRSSIQSSSEQSVNRTQFEMVALADNHLSESWEILVYPNWNISIQGVPAVAPTNLNPTSFWVYQYFPRAGEKIQLVLTKPPAAEGASVAISKVHQVHTMSKRKTTTVLKVDYRATRAETININIGEAQLKSVKHDARMVNLASVEQVVSLALMPGKHTLELEVETAKEIGFKFAIDDIKIDQPFSNLYTQVSVPQNRWLLSASGPGYGPAIVYWGELIFFILLAFGLSKLPFSPLNYLQWLILGMGMSTFSWPALALVAVWLLASEWRRQNKSVFKDRQIILSWLTLFSTFAAVIALVLAVPYGLLQSPDMGVRGNSSYANHLVWFLDQGNQSLGSFTVYTLPLWAYKGMMLLWSTWLSVTLIKWLGWTWNDLADAPFRKKRIISPPAKAKD